MSEANILEKCSMTGVHGPITSTESLRKLAAKNSNATNSHRSKCPWSIESHDPRVCCPGYHGRQTFSTLDAPSLTEVSKVEALSDFRLSLTVYVSFLVREYSSFERLLRLCEGCQCGKASSRHSKNAMMPTLETPIQFQNLLFNDWGAMIAPAKDENM